MAAKTYIHTRILTKIDRGTCTERFIDHMRREGFDVESLIHIKPEDNGMYFVLWEDGDCCWLSPNEDNSIQEYPVCQQCGDGPAVALVHDEDRTTGYAEDVHMCKKCEVKHA